MHNTTRDMILTTLLNSTKSSSISGAQKNFNIITKSKRDGSTSTKIYSHQAQLISESYTANQTCPFKKSHRFLW
jgi:hypothetical protein